MISLIIENLSSSPTLSNICTDFSMRILYMCSKTVPNCWFPFTKKNLSIFAAFSFSFDSVVFGKERSRFEWILKRFGFSRKMNIFSRNYACKNTLTVNKICLRRVEALYQVNLCASKKHRHQFMISLPCEAFSDYSYNYFSQFKALSQHNLNQNKLVENISVSHEKSAHSSSKKKLICWQTESVAFSVRTSWCALSKKALDSLFTNIGFNV